MISLGEDTGNVIDWVMDGIVLESFHAFGFSYGGNSAHKIPKYTCTS